ncbi:hypothetical protein ACQ4PT_041452 [Festuca glaucescens]
MGHAQGQVARLEGHDAFGQCLFLNVDTGRLLWKDLPMLRSYTRVVSGTDGLLVLETTPIGNGSYTICVLNPFTGHLVRVPKTGMCDHDFGGNAFFPAGSTPTLYAFLDARPFASIDPTSGLAFRFTADAETGIRQYTSVATFRGRAYAVDGTGTVVVLGDPLQPGQRAEITAVVALDHGKEHRPLLVDNAGELLLVRRWASDEHGVEIFRVDVENRALETIKGIGSRAIFLAHGWCLSVDADNFPAVQGNCIYDFFSGGRNSVRIYHLTDGRVEKVSVYVPIPLASGSEDPFSYAQLHRIPPLSIVEFILRKCRKLCTDPSAPVAVWDPPHLLSPYLLPLLPILCRRYPVFARLARFGLSSISLPSSSFGQAHTPFNLLPRDSKLFIQWDPPSLQDTAGSSLLGAGRGEEEGPALEVLLGFVVLGTVGRATSNHHLPPHLSRRRQAPSAPHESTSPPSSVADQCTPEVPAAPLGMHGSSIRPGLCYASETHVRAARPWPPRRQIVAVLRHGTPSAPIYRVRVGGRSIPGVSLLSTLGRLGRDGWMLSP